MREADVTDTLAVIALDAADYRLAEEWNCRNVLLDNHDRIETFAYSRDQPITLEVWTSVATGAHPREHGLSSTGEQQTWTNPLLRSASAVAPYVLPKPARIRLGTLLRGDGGDTELTFRQTDHDHAFPAGGVYAWPGITPATHLSQTWHWLELAESGDITHDELWRRLYANAGKELGWVLGMNETSLPVVGVHMHVLDAAGHAYATSEDDLRAVYERVDEMLGTIRQQVDRLVVLSDHGMEVDWIDGDDDPGSHSWRASFGTTESGPLPERLLDVRSWLDDHVESRSEATDAAELDATRAQLEDLGYL